MITETIKTLLGADLSTQVETALKGKGKEGKDIDLVCGNDGTYVPLEVYNGKAGEAQSASNTLEAAAEALKAIGGSGDAAKIEDDVKTAKMTIETLQTNHAAELAKLQKTTALRLALSEKAHDPSDIISMLDLDKIEVDGNGTLKSDLDSLIEPLRSSKAYLFKDSDEGNGTPSINGAKPAASSSIAPKGGISLHDAITAAITTN